jgi:hypothetical protein
MAKTLTTQQSALVRMTGEIGDEHRSHLLRAANFKLHRRMHDVDAAYFAEQEKARADYLAEVTEINNGGDE